jgi:hypothetical protein
MISNPDNASIDLAPGTALTLLISLIIDAVAVATDKAGSA